VSFQLDAIALCEALLRGNDEAYDAVLDADDSPQRLRELVAGAVAGWAAVLDSACGPMALSLLATIRADLLAEVADARAER
jgi:hypothetical protein